MRSRDVTHGRAALWGYTVSSGGFNSEDFAPFRMPNELSHWIGFDPMVRDECWGFLLSLCCL